MVILKRLFQGKKLSYYFHKSKKLKKNLETLIVSLTKSAIMAQALSRFMGPINNFINNVTSY